jgi:hypothetical protein
MAPPSPILKKIDKLGFASLTPTGQDAWLTYRMQNADRWFTAFVLWTHEDKLAQLILKADPPK